MKKQIFVIGHKKPDTDSVASAIAYARLKNIIDSDNEYIPAVCGKINPETEFILDKFNLEKPIKLRDIKTQVKDIISSKFNFLKDTDSIKNVGTLLSQHDISAVPIVSENGEYLGLVSLHTLTKLFLEQMNIVLTDEMQLKFSSLLKAIDGEVYVKTDDSDGVAGKVFIGAMSRQNLGTYICKGDIVIIGNRTEALIQLIEIGVQMLVITGGHKPDDFVLNLARDKGVTIIGSNYHTYKTVRLINLSVPVSGRMDKIAPLHEDDFLSDVMDKVREAKSSLPVVDDNNKLVGMISRRSLSHKSGKNIILVDHNERSQAIDGIEEANILEIIDHHNKSDIVTKRPIYSRQEPIGSTASLIKKIFDENNVEISKKIACILMSAIISDTLYLKSSTTTTQDEIILNDLAKIADVDLEKYAFEIFEAKSQVANKSVIEIMNNDRKEFLISHKKFSIAQLETVNSTPLLDRKSEFIEFMNNELKKTEIQAMFLMVTDIFKQGSHIFVCSYDESIGYNLGADDGYVYLKGVMSRKSDFLPKIYDLF